MMDMCPAELEKHFVLNFRRCDTYPKINSAIMDSVEQIWHDPDPMEIWRDAVLHR